MDAVQKKQPEGLDWSPSDGCSKVPDRPSSFDFVKPCARHDFGYRNYPKQGRRTPIDRAEVDEQFKIDMRHECDKYKGWRLLKWFHCRMIANIYFAGVRVFGEYAYDYDEKYRHSRSV